MGKAVDCGRERIDCGLDALEKVDRRLLAYELARSSFALEGGDVTSGGSDVRFALGDVREAGSLLGDSTSAAMSEYLCRPRTTTPSVMSSSRRESVGMSALVSVMRGSASWVHKLEEG